jgi:hypothetical protein
MEAALTYEHVTSLADKVSTVLGAVAGSGFMDPVQTMSVYPRTLDPGLTAFESDCRDWGFTFGVAYGIARGEDPYESDDRVCERALTAAREVFSRFSQEDIFTEHAYSADRAARPDRRDARAMSDNGGYVTPGARDAIADAAV